MDFEAIGNVLWSRRWVILAVFGVEILLLPLMLKFTRTTYLATSEIAYVGANPSTLLPPTDLPNFVLSENVLNRVSGDPQNKVTLGELFEGIRPKASPRSAVVDITFASRDPERAVLLANAVARATVDEYKAVGTGEYDTAIASLQSQLASEGTHIRQIDAKLERVVSNNSYVGSPSALDTISTRLDDLESQRGQTLSTLVADQSSASSLSGASKGLNDVVREQALASDPSYEAVRTNQAKDVAEYENDRAGYTDQFPGLAGLREKVSLDGSAVSRIATSVVTQHAGASSTYAQMLLTQHSAAAQVSGDQARLSAINAQIVETQSRLRELPNIGVLANQLRLERDSASGAYTTIRQRLEGTIADKNQARALSSIVILDRASFAAPKTSRAVLLTILALLIAAIALGSAYFADYVNPRFRTPSQVENLYGSPTIGAI